jgi:hypothetical protein
MYVNRPGRTAIRIMFSFFSYWQRLEGTLETPLETATGHLALERGDQEIQTRIQAWIDDVKLELLEAP